MRCSPGSSAIAADSDVIGGFAFLFVDAVVGGYWLAQRFEPPKPAKATYARIEDIPGLPHYAETDPGQKLGTFEDKPTRSRSPRRKSPRRRARSNRSSN